MSAGEVWRILRRRWWVVAGLALVAGAAALLYSLARPPLYRARAEMVVLPSRADYELGMYTEARMRTFRAVLLAFPETDPSLPSDLDDRTYVQLVPEEGRIVIEVDDSSPEQAAALANGLAERLQRWVEERNKDQAGPDRILVSVLVPATAPESPSPRFIINILAGLVLGLLLGLPLALLWDAWDDTLGEPAAAASRLGIRVWAAPALEAGGVEVLRQTAGAAAAAWQRLHTSLRFPGPEGPARWRTLAAAGVRRGDLPPALLANLGAAIAQDGSQVLLVDAGFAEPALHRPFGLAGGPGLGEWLQGGGDEGPTTAATEQEGLSLLPAGAPQAMATQAVSLRRAARNMPALARMAEIVLLRLPDLENAPEGLFLAAEADGVVLVARAGHTRLRHVRRALEALQAARARVLGLILWRGGRGD